MSGSFVSSAPTGTDKQRGTFDFVNRRSETQLPPDGDNFSGSQGGAVDVRSSELQWCSTTDRSTKYGDRVRHIWPGLGRTEDGGPVITEQTEDVHTRVETST